MMASIQAKRSKSGYGYCQKSQARSLVKNQPFFV